jgi:drug/metabolite transporter (DMT)-like permease
MPARASVAPEGILFLLLALIWGSSYLVVDLAGTELGPFSLVGTRLVVGVLALAAVALVRRQRVPGPRQWGHFLVVGGLGVAIPFTLITWSQRSVDTGLASIIVAAAPLITALIVAVTRDERVGGIRLLGLVLGFAGVVIVVGGGIGASDAPLAILALLAAAAAYAAHSVYARRYLADLPPLGAALGQTVGALLITGTLALVLERPAVAVPSPAVIGSTLWLGLLASALAPLLYFRLVHQWGAVRTMMVNYLTPLVAVVAGIVLVGERPGPAIIGGGFLIVLGVVLANAGRITIRSGGRTRTIAGHASRMVRPAADPDSIATA